MKAVSSPIANPNGAVLLVDVHQQSRNLRAEMMRNLGATVDCASSATSAIARFALRLYRLVLIDLGEDHEGAEQLALDIRQIRPKQLIGFLIGGPTYIAKTLARKSEDVIPFSASTPTTPIPEPELSHESAFTRKIREVEQESQNQSEYSGSRVINRGNKDIS
jgi:CheY-like chemotaxis protein